MINNPSYNHRKPILQIIRKIFCSRDLIIRKYFLQELFSFLSHPLCCSSYVPSRVIIREIKNLKGAQGNKGAKSKAKSEKKEKNMGFLWYNLLPEFYAI